MLARTGGQWVLEGRPLEDGDLVELRGVHVAPREAEGATQDVEEWFPAVVFDEGRAVELEDPTDAAWSRAAQPRSIELESIARAKGEIRRRDPT